MAACPKPGLLRTPDPSPHRGAAVAGCEVVERSMRVATRRTRDCRRCVTIFIDGLRCMRIARRILLRYRGGPSLPSTLDHGAPMFTTLTVKPRSVREQVSADEWQKRVDLAACYRLLDLYGMSEMSANHVSTRVPGEDNAFLINPHGMLYDQMHASCFIKLDLAGNVLFNPTEYGFNKAGFVIHSCIHAARHDVDCVIHTHTIAGMAVSAMECGLMPIAQTSMRFAQIAYHDYEGVALELDEQARLVRDLGEHDGMILRNHGLLTAAPSIPEAFNSMFRLER